MSLDLFEKWAGIDVPVHGGTNLPDGIRDFSISVNTVPVPVSVSDAYASAWDEIGIYPDASNSLLAAAVSGCFNIPEKQLLMTNGSAEAFGLVASVFLGRGKKAMILSPCYSDYEHVSRLSGADIISYQLKAESSFKIDRFELVSEISRYRPDLIWLCSPNNPTGVIMEQSLIDAAATAAAEYGGFVVVDEAYAAFAETAPPLIEKSEAENIIIVRSLTKDFGVPGLRLGYLSASAEAVRILGLHKPCWSISGPAQKAGAALMDEIVYYKKSWKETAVLKHELVNEMRVLGVDPAAASENSCGIFIFFKAPELPGGLSFAELIYEQGVRVRDCSSMGAPGFCRIGVKQRVDNRFFIDALKLVLNKAG
ncbi:MAG TPA: hypothetical protein DCO79_01090 [Spirochaeta sp.]|nr:hypothetical protein [Spirochaeta sp.]